MNLVRFAWPYFLVLIPSVFDRVLGDESRRPNILFIAVDDLRPSIGCYGDLNAKTPNIDRLAARGVQFNRAYCQVAVCNPSRASLMTGLRPDKLGVWTLPIHFRESVPDAVTLPQWLRKFGYTAISHGKIFHNPTPDPQSWSEAIRPDPKLGLAYPEGTSELIERVESSLPASDWRKKNLRGPSTAAPDVRDDELIDGARTNMAIADLKRLADSSQPFFLAMGYIRPHLAWIAPKKYWDMHDRTQLPIIMDGKVTPNTPPYALSNSYELTHYVDLIEFPKPWDEQRISSEQSRQLMHAYYACVSYVDAQIGRLLDALDEAGLAENTIIVLWSDHGWKLGEFNAWGKMSNYEIDTRVPLLVCAPNRLPAGKQVEQPVELLDVFPTLCDLAGLETPRFVDGVSLREVATGARVRTAPAFSQYYREYEQKAYMGYAMRTDRYRFVEWREFSSGQVTAHELYDHANSDSEDRNVFDEASPDLVDRLTEQLWASHPRQGLTMIPSVHSNPIPGRWPSDIEFVNQTDTELLIFPITAQGRRGAVKKLDPTNRVRIQARLGGVYVVESIDGSIHEIHSPMFPSRPIVIGR